MITFKAQLYVLCERGEGLAIGNALLHLLSFGFNITIINVYSRYLT